MRLATFIGTAVSIAVVMVAALAIRFWDNLPDVPLLELARRFGLVAGIVVACASLCGLISVIRWPGRR